MLNSIILSYITFVYFGAFTFYLLMMITGRDMFGRLATYVSVAGLAAHTLAIVLRWVESYALNIGHAPLSNLYESLIFFGWAIMLFYLSLEWRTKNKSLGAFASPLAFLVLAYASYGTDSNIQPLIPALKSNWLVVHVITCFLGYAAFALSLGFSTMYLLKRLHSSDTRNIFLTLIPRSDILDELNYQIVAMGFIMLTLGIMTGSVWAQNAWGRYWGWDAKETASLVTWLVYAAALHSRREKYWQGKGTAILCIVGFFCVLFTYLGTNYLSKLHGYAAKLF
jgi:cytochrome c-type biogenesis protein CcsB